MTPDRYRGVVLALAAVAALAAAVGAYAGLLLEVPSLFGLAAVVAMASGMLLGTARAAAARSGSAFAGRSSPALLRIGVAVAGTALATAVTAPPPAPAPSAAIVGVVGAGLVALAVAALLVARYLDEADRDALPEARGLAGWGRAIAWAAVVAALSPVVGWAGSPKAAFVLAGALATCAVLLALDVVFGRDPATEPPVAGSGTRLLALFATRLDPVASLFDTLERSFGIDVRSTWAVLVVRRAIEPLVAGIAVVGWLCTSVTIVLPAEQGVAERLGVPWGAPLEPGLHLHLPWPIDTVDRVAVRVARTIPIGHEGATEAGPEDVLWARQHAAKEYTLVLGDGRDLVTVDAAVHYRIRDPFAWRYACQNPEDALRAAAYRAVMDRTVDRTLSDVLSENVAELTAGLKGDVQREADALGIGVEVLSFTVGGMHPPVPVATDYQAVVSAEIARRTAAVAAQAYANEIVPRAEADALSATNRAQADGARARQTAAGESIGFRTLEAAYRADPGEFRFRRRLEALEQALKDRRYTVLDARFERDGAELWLMQ